MPTYQYRCKNCSEEFEKVQSFTDDSTPKCPNCGTRAKKNIVKVFGSVGISFKGSGFYKNDHGARKTPSSASSSSEGSSSSKSETTSSSDGSSGSKATTSSSSSD